MTALERDLESENDYSYYIFVPYNRSNFDDFCFNTNFILTCYYVLFNRFRMTSDEIIFEDIYREGVLIQDHFFELATYYNNAVENEEDIQTFIFMMNEYLDLKPFSNRNAQFDTWKLTYSNQTMKIDQTDDSDFLTIDELIILYDEKWLETLVQEKSK